MLKTGLIFLLALVGAGLVVYQISILSQIGPTLASKVAPAVVQLTGGKIDLTGNSSSTGASFPGTSAGTGTSGSTTSETITTETTSTGSTINGLTVSGDAKNGYVPTSDGNGSLSWEPLPGYAFSQADSNTSGYLSAEDWRRFNSSTGGVSGLTVGSGLTLSGTTITNGLTTGMAGGLTVYGGTGASEKLILESTTSSTKGFIILNGSGGNVGIATTSPSYALDVAGTIRSSTGGVMFPDGSLQTSAGVSSGVTTAGGTPGYMARFLGAETLETSSMYDLGTALTMTIDADNQVGIGTTAPSRLLHLYESPGTTGTTGIRIQNNNGRSYSILSGGSANTVSPSSFAIYDDTAAASRLTILSTGAVGIGITSPTTNLEVNGSAKFDTMALGQAVDANTVFTGAKTFTETSSAGIYGANFVMLNNPAADSAATLYGFRGHAKITAANAFNMTGSLRGVEGQAFHQGTGTLAAAYGGYFGVDNNSSGTVTDAFGVYIKSGVNTGTITNRYGLYQAGSSDKNYLAGSLGIGITSPTTQVEINGTTSTQLTIQTTNAQARMRFRGSGGSYVYQGVNGTDYVIYANNGTGNLMTIQQGGNVGINTTNPGTFKLQVGGSIGPNADISYDLGSSGLKFVNVYASSGVVNTSDQRLKTNIQTLNYGLESLMQLEPVSFNWLSNPDGTRKLGLIAQAVQKVMPELVNVGTDADKTLGIYYTDLIPVTIKAIQQQQTQVDVADAHIKHVDERVASLEAQMKTVLAASTAPAVGTSSASVLAAADTLLSSQTATLSGLLVDGNINTMNLSVIGNATIGEMTFDTQQNAINSLSKPLRLQDIPMQPLEIMASKVVIATNGDLALKDGNLIIEKGRIIGNDIMRGTLILKSGSSSAQLVQTWAEKPKTLLLTPNFDTAVWYENLSPGGFTAKVATPPTSDQEISWFALW